MAARARKGAGRAYRQLLRTLPVWFRVRHGACMEDTFAAAEAAARAGGVRALLALYRREARDVIGTALRLRAADIAVVLRRGCEARLDGLLSGTVRQSLRTAARSPAHAAACVITLALAVASATATLAVVQQAFFRDLPFAGGDDLVAIYTRTETWESAPVSPHVLEDMRAGEAPLTGFAPMDPLGLLYTTPRSTEQVFALQVTSAFFDIVGAPARGRVWTDGERDVVVVTHDFWQDVLEGADVLGRPITLNGVDHIVVGVLPASVAAPFFTGADVFRPIDMPELLASAPRARLDLTVIARRLEGVPQERLDAWLDGFSTRLRERHPAEHGRQHWWSEPLRASLLDGARPALAGTGAAALLLLLIVCANIAGVSAARAVGLRHMLAVQAALGATRGRLLVERLIEGVVLSALGSALGVWLGHLLFHVVAAFQPQFLARMPPLTLGADVLLLGFLAGLVAGTWAAAAPFAVVIGGRLDALGSTRGSTATASLAALRSALVVTEVAVALVLVVGAGLLVRTVRHLSDAALGYRTERLYTVEVDLPEARYRETPAASAFETAALERLRALPQVAAATSSVGVPVIGGSRASFILRGRSDRERHEVAYFSVAPDFMRVMQVPLRAGRGINPGDHDGTPRVMLINELTARQVWPNGDALGARVHFGAQPPPGDTGWVTVIGIVADVRQHGPTAEVLPTAYGSTRQFSWPYRRFNIVAAEGTGPPSESTLRALFHELDSGAAMGEITALTQLIADRTAPQRLVMLALLTLGGVAAALCTFGLYAVVNLTSSLRVREYAIRMAVGAEARGVRWLVLRQALVLGGLGTIAGVAIALAGTRALQGLLHGVTPLDAPAFLAAIALVLLLALLAAWLPAARSARVAAAEVLKS